jgi:hypothetical protein
VQRLFERFFGGPSGGRHRYDRVTFQTA